MRLHWTRSGVKQSQFEVFYNLQKVSNGRKLREQLLNLTETKLFSNGWPVERLPIVAKLCFAFSVNAA